MVAPLVGAWIEICRRVINQPHVKVAPLVGAWIEISALHNAKVPDYLSHPSWVRGLK